MSKQANQRYRKEMDKKTTGKQTITFTSSTRSKKEQAEYDSYEDLFDAPSDDYDNDYYS